RERDNKDRAGCTDPNPLSPEPLAFLLPAHRQEYRFTSAGIGKENDRPALLIDFASVSRQSRLELSEDPRGHEDCYGWSGDLAVMRGGLQSTRRRQTFSDYKRFLTGGRMVK